MHFKSISDTMEWTPDQDPDFDGLRRYRPLPDMKRIFTVTFTGQTDVDPALVSGALADAEAAVQVHKPTDLVTVLGHRALVALAALSEATKRKGGVHAHTP